MTKAHYLEMCEVLGTEPLDAEMPVESEDLLPEVQQAIIIYNALQDQWDYMGGNYIGKNFSYIESVFNIYEIEPELRKITFELLIQIDSIRAKQIHQNKPKDTKPA